LRDGKSSAAKSVDLDWLIIFFFGPRMALSYKIFCVKSVKGARGCSRMVVF